MKILHFASWAGVAAFLLVAMAGTSHAADNDMRITEWMYKSLSDPGEFIELTNTGSSAISLINWSQDDSNRNVGVHSMTGFGTIAAGESVILTELNASIFRKQWGLDASVKVIGYGSQDNLGSGDEINIYNAGGRLIDRLAYGSTGPATLGASGRPSSLAALGANNSALWSKSTVGDIEGSWTSSVGDIGSPGRTSFVPSVPEPSGPLLALASLSLLAFIGRRRQR